MNEPCYTCRRRRVECDRSQVPCAKCQKAGLECFDKRPLRWVKGMAIRGRMQGLSVEDASANSMVSTSRRKQDRANLPLALEDPLLSRLNRPSKYYLDYYNDQICKLFIVYDSDKNPFRSLVPLAMNDSILLKAILALAARHKANTGQPFHQSEMIPSSNKALEDALLFKYQAIQGLSRVVNDPVAGKQDTTVATIFLLIFLDLLESGNDRWNFHLEGAKKLLAFIQQSPDPGRTIQGIRDFITSQIYLIETLGSTFVRPNLLSHFIPLDQRPAEETVEQSFLGCPDHLLNAIRYFSIQRDTIADMSSENNNLHSHIQNVTMMLNTVQSFDCYTWASGLPLSESSALRNTNQLCLLSRSYQIGALVYGRRVLDALMNSVTVLDDLIGELLGVIGLLRDDYSMLKCILWPMCIAGLECHSPVQRDFLTGCMEKFWIDTRCVNVINAARILQEYWQKTTGSSSQWIFHIGHLGSDWLLI